MGHWFGRVNVSRCLESSSTTSQLTISSIKLTADVLDSGTGNRVEGDIEIDTDLPGFQLISLRPGFFRNSANIPIVVSDEAVAAVSELFVNIDLCYFRSESHVFNLEIRKFRFLNFLTEFHVFSKFYDFCITVV